MAGPNANKKENLAYNGTSAIKIVWGLGAFQQQLYFTADILAKSRQLVYWGVTPLQLQSEADTRKRSHIIYFLKKETF